ncbi:MAG: hypothetical protein ABSB74_10235 [Tepidisphaeraceae bacterium]
MKSETQSPRLILPPEPMPDRQRGFVDHLSLANRTELLDRQWLVLHWGEAIREGRRRRRSEVQVTAGIVLVARQRGYKICRSTLFRWRRAFRADGLFGLMDNRWFHKHPSACWPFILALSHIYSRGTGRGKSVKFCHAETVKLADDYDWPRCKLDESERWIREHLRPSEAALLGDDLGNGSTPI